MLPADYHIHTCRDHGAAPPADYVAQAVRLGITHIGLVGHGRTEFPCEYAMSEQAETLFLSEMQALKARFPGQLFCGIEADYYTLPIRQPYDYRIGSVHYVRWNGQFVSVDSDPEQLAQQVQALWGGDFSRLYRLYFELVAQLPAKTNADIIGHLDLITKFHETHHLFSVDAPLYRRLARDAVQALLDKNPIFEINTGAISRGYRTTPYPADWLLREIAGRKGRIIFSSDAHTPTHMLYGFSDAAALARACGFQTAWILTDQGFSEVPL